LFRRKSSERSKAASHHQREVEDVNLGEGKGIQGRGKDGSRGGGNCFILLTPRKKRAKKGFAISEKRINEERRGIREKCEGIRKSVLRRLLA